jgi:branched-chain amino acid transport system permease protein
LELALILLPSTIIDGLVIGLLYAVIALGYTMVYGVLELINFAHSEIFMFGGIVGLEVLIFVTSTTNMHPLLQILAALVVGAAAAGGMAVLVERVAYRPLRARGAPKLVPLITAIGMSLFLQDAVRFVMSFFGQFNLAMPSYPFFSQSIKLTETAEINFKAMTILVVGVLMLAGLTYLVNYTKTGKAIRAVAQDMQTSALMGIDTSRIITLTFLIGGALGGVAGVLFALQFGKLDPFSGFIPGIKSFTAAVLGGIGNIPGAMLGGIVLGLLETFAGTYLPIITNNVLSTEYKDIVAFGALIVILIFRPAGLLGKATTEKV